VSSVGVMKAEGAGRDRAHDRYSPGLHHVAWRAASHEDVDRLHAVLVAIGATVLDPPADYPAYGEGYYAVFVADPDGLKLEFVFSPL
jgi:catechol 2,3-dioxygenase-like lactoylglutathione lyase family enzyme